MNLSGGMSDIAVSVAALGFSAAATIFLYMGLSRGLPVGPSYAVWVGIGVAGIVVIDVLVFGKAFSAWAYLCLFMVISGVIGLNLLSDSDGRDARKCHGTDMILSEGSSEHHSSRRRPPV